MERKPTDPLSGCCLVVASTFVLFFFIILLFKGCDASPQTVKALTHRLSSAFVAVVFWAVVFLFVASTRER